MRYDLLLLNCGLHDIKSDPATESKQVPIQQYRDNLAQIVAISREMSTELISVRTTGAVEEINNVKSSGRTLCTISSRELVIAGIRQILWRKPVILEDVPAFVLLINNLWPLVISQRFRALQ
ncbi:hypothetical protein [Paenibacillus sp. CCS19]|uniref:hypothetical protein n=1 Tax=Paenibacillus sp. CCS19 TaxID=3158387 RepID=UPI00295EB3CA|nr:hypothetical protein [Paenibacillus cellulosilyticus]